MQEWKYELKVRYVPENINDLYEKDKVSFYYFHEQVSCDLYISIILVCSYQVFNKVFLDECLL